MIASERWRFTACEFKCAIFRAETTILLARSGRIFVAVTMHERNFGPTNRTAVAMKPAMNCSAEARTVIDGATVSSDLDAVCWAGTERSESAAVAATKVKRCRILWPKDIGGIAAHPWTPSSGYVLLSSSRTA